MSASMIAPPGFGPALSIRRKRLLELVGILLASCVIFLTLLLTPDDLGDWRLLIWLTVIAIVEQFPIATWNGAQFSVTDPLFIALSMVYPPGVAMLVVFMGALDPRELRRSIPLRTALFSRSQCALSAFVASVAFHEVAEPSSPWLVLTGASLMVAAIFNVMNLSAVALHVSIRENTRLLHVTRRLLLDAPVESAASYLSFAVIGMFVARLYVLSPGGIWVLLSIPLPLVVVARSAYLHIRTAREAAEASEQRARLLRTMSDRVTKERSHERVQLAGLLHDDAIPSVEGMNLTANIALASLDAGDLTGARAALAEIREESVRSAAGLRDVVGDLRRSPLEGRSLREALGEFAAGSSPDLRILVDAVEVHIPEVAALLLYQIAREAVGNAMKHSGAQRIHIGLQTIDEELELAISDDGAGFDKSLRPAGHFGLTLVHERVQALSGRLTIEATPNGGTTVRVRAPLAGWAQKENPASA
jgi:signal transduction histidine kinase